jgi:hypothetical protein
MSNTMIALVPCEIASSMNAFTLVAEHKHKDGYGIEFRTMRSRGDTLIIIRLFDDGREYERLVVIEIDNANISNEATEMFNSRRVPNVISMLMQDWVCEYIYSSHELITWRTLIGGNFVPKSTLLTTDKKEDTIKKDKPSTGSLMIMFDDVILSGFEFQEPFTDKDRNDIETYRSMKEETNDGDDVMPSAFDSYFRSDDWKHSIE